MAQGVQDHSEFKKNPFKRLQGTLEATYTVVFRLHRPGPRRGAADPVDPRVRRRSGYSANEPSNLLWVHATLCDTALGCYEGLVEELPAEEAEIYYQEMKRVAEVFGVRLEHQPDTLADFRRYFDETTAAMEVTDVGRDLAGFILDPELPLKLHVPFKPLLGAQRMFTLGSLPPGLRDQLDAEWSERDQVRYEKARRRVRRVFSAVPRPVRTFGNVIGGPGLLWMAARHVRQFEAKQATRARAAA